MRRMFAATLVLLSLFAPRVYAQGGWTPRDTPPPPANRGDYDYGTTASPDVASVLAYAGTLVPLTAGTVVWAVTGEQSVTSVVLLYLGAVEGPALGYHYAGLHRAAANGTALRGTIALAALLISMDRDTDAGRDAIIAAGTAIDATLALYDAARLRDRMSHSVYGTRLELHPALVGERLVPAVTLRF